jgi:hypothetical protein
MQRSITGKIFWIPPQEKKTRQCYARRRAREHGDKAVARKLHRLTARLLRRTDGLAAGNGCRGVTDKPLTYKELAFIREHATKVVLG